VERSVLGSARLCGALGPREHSVLGSARSVKPSEGALLNVRLAGGALGLPREHSAYLGSAQAGESPKGVLDSARECLVQQDSNELA
jgi:hypothetical protein